MPIATYRDFFLFSLEQSVARGGHPWQMIRLARIHQGEDPVVRDAAFREWLDERPLVCGRCQALFEPDPGYVGEEDYVLCLACGPRFA